MKKEALLYKKLDGGKVHCYLCAHECKIRDGSYGICGVRKNEGGILYTQVYADVIASHVDPIEKKPLYHFLPGTLSYSIATIGCNFKCGFCQNWQISQKSKKDLNTQGYELKPEEVVREALRAKCRSISYTYTEPTIFFEFALDTAKIAREKNIYNVFVSNGFMTEEAIDVIKPYLDGANIDLKSYNDDFYKKTCGGRLEPVKRSIIKMKKEKIWVELTTLLITGENDSEDELNQLTGFISSLGDEIPWHISRFHPDFKYMDRDFTSVKSLERAYKIGKKNGLKYIYLGNVEDGQDTFCPGCSALLVKRAYLEARENNMLNGKCNKCGIAVDGVW